MLRGVDRDRSIRERSCHSARRYHGEFLSEGRNKTVEQRRGAMALIGCQENSFPHSPFPNRALN